MKAASLRSAGSTVNYGPGVSGNAALNTVVIAPDLRKLPAGQAGRPGPRVPPGRPLHPASRAGGPGRGLFAGPCIPDDDRGKGVGTPCRPSVKRPVNTAFWSSDNLCRHAARGLWTRAPPPAQARRTASAPRE
ncbi:hypothetical protein GCM10010259_21170 [Streptomyces daghestanicus]|uniref:Uncharacterized protein n=1 Tax=Streptomyces daghestanicus TaxID=66885 RepID=A0ABQ3Q6V3_9ACTN|nr:hypothetical protein GCM10010259_21170 [Streptomyces daghestanicus]GHI33022.1 hypothetical protein Sdagh_47520 [Streptomyces daghestanicus]